MAKCVERGQPDPGQRWPECLILPFHGTLYRHQIRVPAHLPLGASLWISPACPSVAPEEEDSGGYLSDPHAGYCDWREEEVLFACPVSSTRETSAQRTMGAWAPEPGDLRSTHSCLLVVLCPSWSGIRPGGKPVLGLGRL